MACWKANPAFRDIRNQSVIFWDVCSSDNFPWQMSTWWRTNACSLSPYLFWSKARMQVTKSSAAMISHLSVPNRRKHRCYCHHLPLLPKELLRFTLETYKIWTFTMGIQYISNTYRKVLDNENLSNLWKIRFPQLFSPSTCISKWCLPLRLLLTKVNLSSIFIFF